VGAEPPLAVGAALGGGARPGARRRRQPVDGAAARKFLKASVRFSSAFRKSESSMELYSMMLTLLGTWLQNFANSAASARESLKSRKMMYS
jgi:hypothetical protein